MGAKSRPGGWTVPAGPVYVPSLDLRDLLITTFNGNDLSMTISHVPSGESATGKGDSYLRLRDRLMAELEAKVRETHRS